MQKRAVGTWEDLFGGTKMSVDDVAKRLNTYRVVAARMGLDLTIYLSNAPAFDCNAISVVVEGLHACGNAEGEVKAFLVGLRYAKAESSFRLLKTASAASLREDSDLLLPLLATRGESIMSKHQKSLVRLIDLSYVVVNLSDHCRDSARDKMGTYESRSGLESRNRALKTKLRMDGWEDFVEFWGLSGVGYTSATPLLLKRAVIGAAVESKNMTGLIAVNRSKKFVCVAFHGSRSGSDWTTNLDADSLNAISYANFLRSDESNRRRFPTEFLGQKMGTDVEFHRGFALYYQSCKTSLEMALESVLKRVPEIAQSYRWIFLGHSLGAAICHLAAIDFLEHWGMRHGVTKDRVGVYSLSTPVFCNEAGVLEIHKIAHRAFLCSQIVWFDPVTKDILPDVKELLSDAFRGAGGILGIDGTKILTSDRGPRFFPGVIAIQSFENTSIVRKSRLNPHVKDGAVTAWIATSHLGSTALCCENIFDRKLVSRDLPLALEAGEKWEMKENGRMSSFLGF